jgi:transposase
MFRGLYEELAQLEEKIDVADRQIQLTFQGHEDCQRIGVVEGIGPLTATVIIAAISNGRAFANGRQFAAWLGLVPRQNASGGKTRLMGISKRGDPYLRTLLIHGARSVVYRATNKTDKRSLWIEDKQQRLGTTKACVAVANKNSRIVWSLIAREQVYRPAA